MIERRHVIKVLESAVGGAASGLPEEAFLLVSRMTPLVNVDLLVQDAKQGTLLTWRHDEFDGPGWHVPGGIVRFQETLARRIRETARIELGADVAFEPVPLVVAESIHPTRTIRGHFISLLFRCSLLAAPAATLRHMSGPPVAGQWRWHTTCPEDIIEFHRDYADFF